MTRARLGSAATARPRSGKAPGTYSHTPPETPKEGAHSWEAIHRIAGEQLEGYDRVSYVSKTCDSAVFDDDLLELDRVAGMVLGLD